MNSAIAGWAAAIADSVADLAERERHNLGFRARVFDAVLAAVHKAEEHGRTSSKDERADGCARDKGNIK